MEATVTPFRRSRARVLFFLTVFHFGMSILIIRLTFALTEQAALNPDGNGQMVVLLVRLTRLLHFPLVTLALYPREWFPGGWVYVPMALNSVIWACGIYWVVRLFRGAAAR